MAAKGRPSPTVNASDDGAFRPPSRRTKSAVVLQKEAVMSNFSVNTNMGASIALQQLSSTNSMLDMTQSRINTGLAVASTKDDSSSYTIAQSLRSDLGGMKAVTSSLSRAKSVTDVAVAGAESISDLLNQMKNKAQQAADSGIDQSSRDALSRDFVALRDQITTVVKSATFNNTNLLQAGGGTVSALKSIVDGDTTTAGYQVDALSISNQGMDLGGSVVTVTATDQLSSAATAQTLVDTLTTSITNVNTVLSTLGSASRQIDSQLSFTTKLSDAVEGGIGQLVDADMAKESANLAALQTKQQLGIQALSIANKAPQALLGLFR
jgi:flagellin